MLMIMPVNCKESETLLRLWAHESMRVFHDRLVGKDDKELFKNMLVTILNQNQSGNTSYEELFDGKCASAFPAVYTLSWLTSDPAHLSFSIFTLPVVLAILSASSTFGTCFH